MTTVAEHPPAGENVVVPPPPPVATESSSHTTTFPAPPPPTTTTNTNTTISTSTQPPPTATTAVVAPPPNISYSAERIIGNGSFGVVFEAKVVETGEIVAIKKVLQDKRFKNRELQIMRQLVKDPHPNIVPLQHCFYSQVGDTHTLLEFVVVDM